MTAALSTDELIDKLRSQAVVDAVAVAAPLLDVSRTTAYALIKAGRFPVEVIRVGSRYRCRSVDVLRVLGIERVA